MFAAKIIVLAVAFVHIMLNYGSVDSNTTYLGSMLFMLMCLLVIISEPPKKIK